MNKDRRLVTRVVLRNYKSIPACDISPAQLTFLVGPNGSGKSNFLDAIRFVADSLRYSIDHALRDRGGIKEVRRRSGGHPNHFGIRLEFNLRESKGHYAFRIGAEPQGGHQIQREECYFVPRHGGEAQYYCVERGEMIRTSLVHGPATASDRLFLVSASGLPGFRSVYDALSNTGFYNLRPEAISDLQPPDPGDLLNRDGSNIASVLAGLAKRSPTVKKRMRSTWKRSCPGWQGSAGYRRARARRWSSASRSAVHGIRGGSSQAACRTERCVLAACYSLFFSGPAPMPLNHGWSASKSRKWLCTPPPPLS